MMKLYAFAFVVLSSIAAYASEVEDFNYCVSTMWFNREKDETQQYIAPQKCLDNAKEWHETLGEEDAVKFWYDGSSISKNALAQTKEHFERHSQIDLCDIRDLDKVRLNAAVFSRPIPFFFWLDILREEATLTVAAQKKFKYIAYADQDIPVMTKDALFYKDKMFNNPAFPYYYPESETLKSLKRCGLTACKENGSCSAAPENSFFIVDRDNPHMLQARQIGLVDINILRAKAALKRGYFGTGEDYDKKNPMKECKKFVDMQEIIYSSIPGMVKLYHLMSGKGTITNENFEPEPSFNRDTCNWIDLFDLKSHKFKNYTQLEVMFDACGPEIFETQKYAPNDARNLFGGIHRKCVGQPASQFVH